jgi:hypothetical protein
LSDAPTFECAVVDNYQLPVAGVVVIPTVVDGLLGMVWPIESLQTTTNLAGRGSLHGLPDRLEPYQQLGLLLLPHVDAQTGRSHRARWVPLPDAHSDAATAVQWRWSLDELVLVRHRLRVEDLGNISHDVLEEIAVQGLPRVSVVRRQQVSLNVGSSPSALVGDGRVWLRSHQSPSQTPLRGMYLDLDVGVLKIDPDHPIEPPTEARLRQLQPLVQVSGFEVVRHHRNEFLEAEGVRSNFTVAERFSDLPLSQARCYAIDPDGGAARVLGISGSAGELSGSKPDNWRVLAIWNGRLGFTDATRPTTASVLHVGSLALGPNCLPPSSEPQPLSLLLRLTAVGDTPLGQLHATFWQYAVPNYWLVSGLPVGQYEAQLPSDTVVRPVTILPDGTVTLN